MDFAADAVVVDAIAPSPARSNARAPAQGASDAPSFDEHLAAESAEAPAAAKPAHNNKESAPTDASRPETPDAIAAPLPAPAPQVTAAPPVLLQVIASVTAPAPAAPQQAAQPATPAQAQNSVTPAQAAPDITPAAPSPQPAAPPVEAEAREQAKIAQAQAQPQTPNAPAASQAITPPPTGASETPIAASPSVAPTAAPTPAPAAIPTPIAAPVAATPPPLAPPTQTRAPQTPEAKPTAESGKSAAAPTSQGAAKAPNGAQAQNNVAQPAQTADFGAFALSDAPDAPAQAQSNAAAITTQTAASAQHASAVEQVAQRAAPAAAQLSREIIRRFDGGNTRFEFRLDPPELGRVEIKLEVTRDHRVSAVISADNPAALSDLARHARELEQSLQSAGLDLSENGLSFDLREGGDEAGDTSGDAGKSRSPGDGAENDALSTNTPQTARLERWRGTRIDVMA